MHGAAVVLLWGLLAPNLMPQRVLVRAPIDADLERRLKAQVVDLPCALSVVAARPDTQDNLQGDLELAEAHPAQVVVRVQAGPQLDYDIRLTHVAEARAYHRRVLAPQGEASAAAIHETVAVLLRNALEALLQTQPLPWAVQTQAETPRWALGVFTQGVGDGLSLYPGLGLSLQVGWGAWRVGLSGAFGLARQAQVGPVRLQLTHHVWTAQAALRWPVAEEWGLDTGVRAGLGLRRRRTLSVGLSQAPTPDQQALVGRLGAYLGLYLDLGAVEPWLALGLDGVLGAGDYQVIGADGAQSLQRAWPVQPWFNLGASVVF